MEPNLQYLRSMRVVIPLGIHLDLLPSFNRTQSPHSTADCECCCCPCGKEREVGGEATQQPPTTPIQIYYSCSHSGHFTAVFTLDHAMSIRWQGPGLQMLPITHSQIHCLPFRRPTTNTFSDTFNHKKENPIRNFPQDHNLQHDSKSNLHLRRWGLAVMS